MVTLKNRNAQPYTINVPGQSALYIFPKQVFDVTDDQFNATEIQEKVDNKDFIVVRMY